MRGKRAIRIKAILHSPMRAIITPEIIATKNWRRLATPRVDAPWIFVAS